MTTPLRHRYEIYIRTTPARLWQAITDPAFTRRYFYRSLVESDFRKGSPIRYLDAKGCVLIEGKILESLPPRRLVTTFAKRWDSGRKPDPPSRLTWEITPMAGRLCKLSLVHDRFPIKTATYKAVQLGWNPVLSGLKTLLETGSSLFPAVRT